MKFPSTRSVDYIIAGLGLAGACLALQLIRAGKSVFVFDQPEYNRATLVAPGLINPITGKVLSKTFMADTLFPYAFSFYGQIEEMLALKFIHPVPVYRPFLTIEEQNEWMGRSTEGSMRDYIDKIFTSSAFGDEVHDPFGGVLLKQSGYLDTQTFIKGVRQHLIDAGGYAGEEMIESRLSFHEDGVVYDQLTARRVIYCRGVADWHRGYFSWLPIHPLKGETLQIKMNGKGLSRIYNRGVYVVPAGKEGVYNVGSTYDRDITPGMTEKGYMELVLALAALRLPPHTNVGSDWGIRPTTSDRRPILGAHPKYPNLVVFNGLGTKGVTLAPYFSGHLASWLEGKSEILPEVNIGRFKSLYSKFE